MVTSDKVLTEIAKLAYSNINDYIKIDGDGLASIDLSSMTRDQAAAITEITVDSVQLGGEDSKAITQKVKLKFADKGINLDRLGRHLKLFTDKVEHSGEFNVNMPVKAADLL